MYKWTLDENKQMIDNQGIEELGIFQLPDKLIYHYTSREVFWKIIDSETLLARHIMFSNDTEENEIGTRKVKRIMEEKGIPSEEIESLPFMVCFCEKKDLLSQWRGYANEGIALGFDFSKGFYGKGKTFSPYHCFTVMNNEEHTDSSNDYINTCSVLKKGEREQKKYFMGSIAAPYHVIYVDKSEDIDQVIEDIVEGIMLNCEEDLRSQRIAGLIPYIKNDEFEEESEYRLIFNMKNLLQEDMHQLLEQKYVNLEVAGIRKPNIKIKFGNQMDAEERKDIRIYYGDDDVRDILKSTQKELRKDGISIKLTKRASVKGELLISNGMYQTEICTILRKKLRLLPNNGKEIKIWCDGHLPIREIIVGPSKDAEYMVNSIKEHVKTKYWLRDVKVEASQIPLRN